MALILSKKMRKAPQKTAPSSGANHGKAAESQVNPAISERVK
jgi:hypothetical protein